MNKAIIEFKELGTSDIYSMSKIEWWLSKYEGDYLYSKSNWIHNSCCGPFPCLCTNKSEEYLFKSFYETLNEISRLYRLNRTAQKELDQYNRIKGNREEEKAWMTRNEKLAAEELACFFMDYFPDNGLKASNVPFLEVSSLSYPDLTIKISSSEFTSIITYKELFDELFYLQETQ